MAIFPFSVIIGGGPREALGGPTSCSVSANAHCKGMQAALRRLCLQSRRARFACGAGSPLITELSRPQRLALQKSWAYQPAGTLPGVSTRIAVSDELSRKLPRRRRSSTAELRPNCATKHRASVLSGERSTRHSFILFIIIYLNIPSNLKNPVAHYLDTLVA